MPEKKEMQEGLQKIVDEIMVPINGILKEMRLHTQGMLNLKADMKIVKRALGEYWGVKFPIGATQTSSPTNLNGLGKLVYQELKEEAHANFEIYIETKAKTILDTLKTGKLDFTPYNIQNASYDEMENEAFDDFLSFKTQVEKVAYNNGNNISVIKEVLAITLRDYFIAHYQCS